MNKTEINKIFEYVKDHLIHFGFYPADCATYTDGGEEKEIEIYPNYISLFTPHQIMELDNIFINHPDYKKWKDCIK